MLAECSQHGLDNAPHNCFDKELGLRCTFDVESLGLQGIDRLLFRLFYGYLALFFVHWAFLRDTVLRGHMAETAVTIGDGGHGVGLVAVALPYPLVAAGHHPFEGFRPGLMGRFLI